jgi:hypothetical protein
MSTEILYTRSGWEEDLTFFVRTVTEPYNFDAAPARKNVAAPAPTPTFWLILQLVKN